MAMQVKLVPHVGVQDSPTGPVTITHPLWRVMVVDEALKGPPMNIAAGDLMVGFIGSQPGANFCPTGSYYRFLLPQREFIEAEAKRLHGNASSVPAVDVPPPLPEGFTEDDL